MQTPKVTVILPVYNAAPYLGKTLCSLSAQTLAAFELIAIDDGSTDDSLTIMASWARRDCRIKLVHQENRGLVETLNRGLEMASCKLIARADADDIYHPERLQRQVDFMERNPETVLLGARTIKVDSADRLLFHEYQPLSHSEIVEKLIRGFGGAVPHPVAMFRKSAAVNAGGYRAEARHCEDLDLWLRLADAGRLANLPGHMVQYRVHHSSVSASHWLEQRSNARKIAEKWAKNHSMSILGDTLWDRPPQTNGSLARFWSGQALRNGNQWSALRQAIYSLRFEPLRAAAWRTFLHCFYRWITSPVKRNGTAIAIDFGTPPF